ncbi:MAG: preprotein translocase subunit SecG [Clostridia bacterium]|nr:preprotein translocase subunit SecG [Clostridia bacterium]
MLLVLLQSNNEDGSIVTGATENNSMGMSRDKKLARLTAYVGAAFVILTIASSTIMLVNVK